MRYLPILALATSMPCFLAAQATESRTFRIQSAATDQDFLEVAQAALQMSDLITAKSSDAVAREFSVSGSAEQIGTAEWVLKELDRPASSTPLPHSAPFTLATPQRGNENTVRVFYPGGLSSNQDLMEVSTAIRTITDIRRVGVYVSHRAIVVRGTPEQLSLAEWLLAELNREVPQGTYSYPDPREDNRVLVLRFARAKDAQQFNEAQTMIRTLTETRRVYPWVGKRAIALRGTEEQLDLAKWILAQVDKDLPLAQNSTSPEYTTKNGDIVKMFYFGGAMSPQAFLDAGTNIRSTTGIRRAYPFGLGRTFAARGTAAQIAHAGTLIPK